MKFAVIDNTARGMTCTSGRGKGYANVLRDWGFGQDYEFVRYNTVARRREELRSCSGLILSGSERDFANRTDCLNTDVYEETSPEFELIRDFSGPVLGVCFGHQLLSLAEEFESQPK